MYHIICIKKKYDYINKTVCKKLFVKQHWIIITLKCGIFNEFENLFPCFYINMIIKKAINLNPLPYLILFSFLLWETLIQFQNQRKTCPTFFSSQWQTSLKQERAYFLFIGKLQTEMNTNDSFPCLHSACLWLFFVYENRKIEATFVTITIWKR